MKKSVLIGSIVVAVVIAGIVGGVVISMSDNNGGSTTTTIIPQHIHTEVIDEAVAATCTTTGLTEGKHCSECDQIIVAQKTIPVSHVESDWILDKEATKTKDGAKHTECTLCKIVIQEQTISAGSQGLEYTLNKDGTYCVSGYGDCFDEELVIPRTYQGKLVTTIGESAFEECPWIKSVEMPDTVTHIGRAAFLRCTQVESIIIPDSIISIGWAALGSLYNLKFNEYGNARYLGNENNPYLIIVEEIDRDAKSYKIHSDTKFIYPGIFAFAELLETITIPQSVINIGGYAFNGCKMLRTINFEGTIEQWSSITKEDYWDVATIKYTIYCTDGTITNDGTVTYK